MLEGISESINLPNEFIAWKNHQKRGREKEEYKPLVALGHSLEKVTTK